MPTRSPSDSNATRQCAVFCSGGSWPWQRDKRPYPAALIQTLGLDTDREIGQPALRNIAEDHLAPWVGGCLALVAGARAVLVTLWPVEDTSARLLMEGFYRRLLNQPAASDLAATLQEAQRELRALPAATVRQRL